jgi:type II secretory pathway component PulF
LAAFNEQLASLIKTKLPLVESLRHLSKEIKNSRLKSILQDVSGQVESGKSLSESLSGYATYFPPLYASMIEAGEKSGNVAEVLFLIAAYFRSTRDMKRKLLNIMIYPLMLTFLAMAVLFFLIKLMVPPYVEMYSTFQVRFPAILSFLVQIEKLLQPVVILVGVVLVAAVVLILSIQLKRPGRGKAADHFVLKIPIWGEMIKEALLAQGLSTLELLLRSGVPLQESLRLVSDTISNRVLQDAFSSATEDVSEGRTLSENLVRQPLVSLEIAWIIRNGEINGNLTKALANAASMCQSKFEFSSRMILSVLEPLLLFSMGAIIVSIAIALFYPLYALARYLGV